MSVQGINPKDQLAVREDKAPLNFLEPAGNEAIARALKFGGDKYGPRNYLQTPVLLSVYIAAMERHIDALKRGEDVASDSGISHFGHVGAGVHIVEQAKEWGTLVDDRVLPPKRLDVPDELLAAVQHPAADPCPDPANRRGVCDCADVYEGGYPECRAECQESAIPPHPDSWEATRGQ